MIIRTVLRQCLRPLLINSVLTGEEIVNDYLIGINYLSCTKWFLNKNICVKVENNFLTALEYYYGKQETTIRECLLALKAIVLSIDENIVHTRKYQIPFFSYTEFNLGFLWVYRKKIIAGFIEDKKTFSETTIRRKKDNVTTMEINPFEDIPVDKIRQIIQEMVKKYNDFTVTNSNITNRPTLERK